MSQFVAKKEKPRQKEEVVKKVTVTKPPAEPPADQARDPEAEKPKPGGLNKGETLPR
jgi:hypothetical protein